MLKMTRRHAALAGVAAIGAVALTGCSKPTSEVTLVSGSNSVNSQAACYNHNGKSLDQDQVQACLNKGAKTLTAKQGGRLAIGVDQSIADNGWQFAINGQAAVSNNLNTTYYDNASSLTLPDQNGTFTITVFEVGKTGGARGVWNFKVKVDGN